MRFANCCARTLNAPCAIPDFTDTSLRHIPPCFEGGGTHIAERLMQPLAIVKHLDKLKDVALRLVTGVKRAVMHQLILQRAKEALSHGVVVAVPAATQAGARAVVARHLPIARRGILTTLVRMMNEPRPRPAVRQGHRQRGGGERTIHAGTHRPADHSAGVQIQHDGQIHPAGSRGNGRDVSDPDAIGDRDHQPWPEAIRGGRRHLVMFRHDPKPSAAGGFQALASPQASDSMFAARDARSGQRAPQLDGPIDTAGLVMQADDLRSQLTIRHGAGTHGPGQPLIEPTATHVQHPAHPHNPKLPAMGAHEGVLHGRSLAKYAAAFFKMSRSSVSRATSRRRRARSAAGAGCRPEPGDDASWCASNWAAHLYSRFPGIPNSPATSAAGRPDCVRSRTASSLNSLVNRCRWPIVHLRGHLVPFRGVRQTRASSGYFSKSLENQPPPISASTEK